MGEVFADPKPQDLAVACQPHRVVGTYPQRCALAGDVGSGAGTQVAQYIYSRSTASDHLGTCDPNRWNADRSSR